MFCKQCGKELPDQAKFCTDCGGTTNGNDIEPVPQADISGTAARSPEPFVPINAVPIEYTICKGCGRQLPPYTKVCKVCMEKPFDKENTSALIAKDEQKTKKKALTIALAVAGFIVLIVIATAISNGSKPRPNDPVVGTSQNKRGKAASTVTFEEPGFEAAVRSYLNIPEGEPISEELCKSTERLELGPDTYYTLAGLPQFPNLKELYVEDPKSKNIAGIEECSRLQSLTLIGCSISDMSVFESLPELRELHIFNNGNTLDTKGINKLQSLKKLSLAGFPITEAERIGELASLEYLDITDSSVVSNDWTPLGKLYGLKTLYFARAGQTIGGTSSYGDVSFLENLKNLEDLTASYYFWDYTYENELPLRSLPKLKCFSIDLPLGLRYWFDPVMMQLSESGALAQLELLIMQGGRMSKECVSLLSKATQLQTLELDYTGNESLDALKALTKLRILRMNGSLDFVAFLPNLEELQTDNGAWIGKATSLKTLDVTNSYYNDGTFALSDIVGLKKLEWLKVNGGKVNVHGIAELPLLKEIVLNYSDFISDAPLDDFDISVTRMDDRVRSYF